jgi:hypothetical protein
MNINKLVEKAEDFLNSDERKRKQKRKYLKEVIHKLKKHEKALKEKLEKESDEGVKEKLKKEIGLAHAQRKKGLKNLKALKKTPKAK